MQGRALLQISAGAVIISLAAPLVKLAHVGPTTAGFYRVLIGAVVLLAVAGLRRDQLWKGKRQFVFAFACGLFFALDLMVWHRSIEYVGPGLATVLASFQVFILAGVGFLFFGERPTARFMFAVLIAFGGLWMLIGGDWFAATPAYRIGVGYGLLTALLYSLYLLTLRRAQSVTPRLSAESNLFWICVISAALLGPAALATGESLVIPDQGSALSLLALGVFPQVVGWTLISRALPYLRAGLAGLILLGQPALSFVWDVIFFGRPTTTIEAAGAVLALVGIYMGTMVTRGVTRGVTREVTGISAGRSSGSPASDENSPKI